MSRGDAGNRTQRRHARRLEQRAVKTGQWGDWETTDLPHGIPGSHPAGWCSQVRRTHRNELYVALERTIQTEWGPVIHLAIRTASNLEPPWRDKQRIKDELFGRHRQAIEVMPPDHELVDEADMYHIWILPPEFTLPFTLANRGQR